MPPVRPLARPPPAPWSRRGCPPRPVPEDLAFRPDVGLRRTFVAGGAPDIVVGRLCRWRRAPIVSPRGPRVVSSMPQGRLVNSEPIVIGSHLRRVHDVQVDPRSLAACAELL
eukprot:476286-Pyramimonas_sp.AAC.1